MYPESKRSKKIIEIIIGVLFFTIVFSSCIKKAPQNIEADILTVTNDRTDFLAEPKITNAEVKLSLNEEEVDLKSYALKFTLSRGATSIPASGAMQDFSNPVEYVVTSENGEFKKTYRVSAQAEKVFFTPFDFDFENFKIDAQHQYTSFFDMQGGAPIDTWSSGNAGFVLSLSPFVKKQPKLYPMQFSEDAHKGKYAVKLETKSTGTFGAGAKKPIAAGNVFLGTFDATNVLGDPLRSTKFGMPIDRRPISLSGYYRYLPGKKVIDQNSKPVDMQDTCSIVAVLFDAEALHASSGSYFLDGNTILSSPHILAKAMLYDAATTPGVAYQHFSIPLVYTSQNLQLDFATGRYKIAIVLSSSKNGDHFIGAVGSVLFVDDLKINVQ